MLCALWFVDVCVSSMGFVMALYIASFVPFVFNVMMFFSECSVFNVIYFYLQSTRKEEGFCAFGLRL